MANTKKKIPSKDLPAHFYDAARRLKEAGEFNVGTKLYKNGKKARKARGE